MIILTENAVKRLNTIAEEEGLSLSIRVQVRGGGCNGFINDMCFDDIQQELDEVFEQDGIKILIDAMSLQYLDGTAVDYVEAEFSSGFKFINPNTKATCGCGSSYSV